MQEKNKGHFFKSQSYSLRSLLYFSYSLRSTSLMAYWLIVTTLLPIANFTMTRALSGSTPSIYLRQRKTQSEVGSTKQMANFSYISLTLEPGVCLSVCTPVHVCTVCDSQELYNK